VTPHPTLKLPPRNSSIYDRTEKVSRDRHQVPPKKSAGWHWQSLLTFTLLRVLVRRHGQLDFYFSRCFHFVPSLGFLSVSGAALGYCIGYFFSITMPFPSTLDAKPKIIFFTDFDGTITLKDSEKPSPNLSFISHTILHTYFTYIPSLSALTD
jgi:hypothetical protein